jgi:hypothetical protein
MKKRTNPKTHLLCFMAVPPLDESRIEDIDWEPIQFCRNSIVRKDAGREGTNELPIAKMQSTPFYRLSPTLSATFCQSPPMLAHLHFSPSSCKGD